MSPPGTDRPDTLPCDLLLMDVSELTAVRRALWDLDCVRAVVLRDGACRMRADPGTAPIVVGALRAQG
ncbi:MAG TPA: hypothetical protein VIR33_04795, partial [Thermopolyspora sp.]